MTSQVVSRYCSTRALTGASRPSEIDGLAFDDEPAMHVVIGNQPTTNSRSIQRYDYGLLTTSGSTESTLRASTTALAAASNFAKAIMVFNGGGYTDKSCKQFDPAHDASYTDLKKAQFRDQVSRGACS